MTEELPLPPDVRATQADALNALGLHWECDYEGCVNPGIRAGRSTCCQQTRVFCHQHLTRYLSLMAGVNRAQIPVPCMHCGQIYYWPTTTPSSFYSYSFPLDKAGTA